MVNGIINTVLGAVGIVLGLNGFQLMFTHSSTALVAGGVGVLSLGAYQIWRERSAR